MMFGQSYSSSSSGGRGGGEGLVNGKLASSCCIMFLIFLLFFVQRIDDVNALASFLFSKKTSTTRYFTHEGVLPPLHLSTPPSQQQQQQQQQPSNIINSTIIPYSSPATSTSCISEESVVPVTYTNDPKTIYQWVTKNLPHEGCILGVDVESVHPGFHSLPNHRGRGSNPFHSAATVQLATPNACLVVHMVRKSGGQFSYACAPILKAIFEDERYIKAGCALDGDFLSLHEIWGPSLQAKSRLDLGLIGIPQQQQKQHHKTTTVSTGGRTTSTNSRKRRNKGNQRTRHGLKSLSHSVLNIDLPKPKEVAVSDWSNVPLSDEQIIYSARDAWAGAMIGQKLADYDPDTFNVQSLMQILGEREPSISELAHRRKRRINAKRALARLLAPYRKKKTKTRHRQKHQKHHHHQLDLPKTVHDKAQNLRVVIKQKISNDQLCFATDHLDIGL